ncbi:MAG TPA: hypothetical protein VI365_09240 [Trebonia sp.]
MLEHDPRVRGAAAGELRDGAARVLARYELTVEIRIVDALPRTPSGKVDLMGVRRLFAVPGDKP